MLNEEEDVSISVSKGDKVHIPTHSGRPFRSDPATLDRVTEAALDNRFESL